MPTNVSVFHILLRSIHIKKKEDERICGILYFLYALQSFRRLELKPGEKVQVEFKLSKENFLQIDENGESFLPKGEYNTRFPLVVQFLQNAVWNLELLNP